MEVDPNERPISIQLFDCRPDFLAEAAQMAVAEGADTVDINMGCPLNKITKNGGGSSLLREPEVAEAIVRSVAQAVQVPVTVKTRIGWNDNEINILDFARRMEAAGAPDDHRPRADAGPRATMARPKMGVDYAGEGNSDDPRDCQWRHFLGGSGGELPRADGGGWVMCSRGTLGYPFLVGEIDYFLKTGDQKPAPSPIERLQCAREHLEMLWEYKGDRGVRQARKHMTWYSKGFAGAAELRGQLSLIETVQQGVDLIDRAIDRLALGELNSEAAQLEAAIELALI